MPNRDDDPRSFENEFVAVTACLKQYHRTTMAKLIETRAFYNVTCDTNTVDIDLEWMLFHVSQWFLRGVIIGALLY